MSEPLSATTATAEEQYAAVEAMLEGGVDLLEQDLPVDMDSRPAGAKLPGSGSPIQLTTEEEKGLADYLYDMVDIYGRVMAERHQQETDINDAYSLRPRSDTQGVGPGAAELSSTLMLSLVDQTSARITSNMMELEPRVRFKPIVGPGDDSTIRSELAESAQRFFNAYLERPMRWTELGPIAILRACKVGTSVLYAEWVEEDRAFIGVDGKRSKRKEGRLKAQLLPNRNVFIWPPTLISWQEEYQVVGHHAFYTIADFKVLAKKLKASEEKIRLVEMFPDGDPSQEEIDKAAAEGMDLGTAQDLTRLVKFTQVYCKMPLPGKDETERYYCLIHLPTRQLFWIDYNPYRSQKMPYFPYRYKRLDECAWGNGVGHEAMQGFLVDSAMSNLEMDNAMAGAFHLIVRKAGSVHESHSEKVFPGQHVYVDDPTNDFVPKKIGGEARELDSIKANNLFSTREATGQAPVLSGLGDPTQKSGGGGTGATVAMIEQAGKKFGEIDRSGRVDISEFFQFVFETICQFAPNGVIYRHADPEDAEKIQLLRYSPPEGDVGEMFSISASAPSAATSKEARKQMLLMVSQFVTAHLQTWLPMAQEHLQATNPAGWQRLVEKVLSFQEDMTQRIIDENDLPHLRVPGLPEPMPADEQINQLQGELNQVNQAYQQLQAEYQQHMASMGMGQQGMMEGQQGVS